jgi:hypothetical protein
MFSGRHKYPFYLILWRCRKKQDERSDLQATCPHYRHTATCMDIATATYPSEFKENLPGKSLLPPIHGKKIKPRELYFEHQSSCAIISNHWKLVRGSRNEPWELIDLSADPFETKDLSAQYPKLVKKLEAKWNKWAKQCNVFPLENKPWTERINYYLKQNPDQSGIE